MSLKKCFAPLLFIVISAIGVAAQETKCSVKLVDLPAAAELRGFRAGMTVGQVKARVPPIVFGQADRFGLAKTSINPAFDPKFDRATFEGVRTVSLNFLDGQLIEVWIGYDSSFKWQQIDEFVAGFSKALGLRGTWQAKGRGQQITCDGVQIFASMVGGSPTIRITDTAGEQTLTNRMEEAANQEEAAEAAASAFVGDKRSKLFYPPGCAGATDVEVANRVVFKDLDEAQKAGYKLARSCN